VVCEVAVSMAVTELRFKFVTKTMPVYVSAGDAPALELERIIGSGPMRSVTTGIQSARRMRRRPTEATGIFIAIAVRTL
jgi:hypothetical protein